MKRTYADETRPGSGLRIQAYAVAAALIPATVAAVPPGHGAHPPMPGQHFHLQLHLDRADGPVTVDVPLELVSPAMPAQPAQTINLPGFDAAVRVDRYLPAAVMEQSVTPADTDNAGPAVLITIDGPTQSHQRWLLAADSERNRLTSFIATWRYMAVDDRQQRDALFQQFQEERSREPALVVRPPNAPAQRFPAIEGRNFEIADGVAAGDGHAPVTLRVLEFFPHFALDQHTNEPTNLSDERINPAVRVEARYRGVTDSRWLFARFPDFEHKDKRPLPFHLELDCPVAARGNLPDFVLITIAADRHELWQRYGGEILQRTLAINDAVEIPGAQYTFAVRSFVPHGRLTERYRPADHGGQPALKVHVSAAPPGEQTLWLTPGKPRFVETPHGTLTVGFGHGTATRPGGHP